MACHASVMRGEVRQGRATHGLGVSIGDVGCGVVRSGMVGKAWQRKICRSSNGKARLAWVRSVLFCSGVVAYGTVGCGMARQGFIIP